MSRKALIMNVNRGSYFDASRDNFKQRGRGGASRATAPAFIHLLAKNYFQ